ncbi:putative rhamnogalacturonate lyase C [Tolypocladium ophioglossoides CBS 100239]|uniref:Putative rhamnogalacturonate lyase C n=1 Tax=Tolypocladium ophioglossoides (strain CBS 100239) TaxID=1163406 RepID=A0A0L0NCI5_TOLOC|nr:putative rhamnogalacturonate lyase C [Tolypocladium ophioglossoides CBS 100239]
MAPRLRRTRIVCISDTHNCTVKLPKGDILIHAGDLTNQGSYSELSKTVKWLEAADFEAKIVVAGNHDITLDPDFYNDHGPSFHNQNPQSPETCLSLFTSSPSITYLSHAAATIRLASPAGPHTELTSPRHGLWAFYYDAPQDPTSGLTTLWERIPLATDVVVTHTPPRTHRDETDERRAAGCEALRRALWRVRPRLAICGHIHDGRGAERVTCDLDGSPGVAYAEERVLPWMDAGEGNNKLSLVDLTGKHAPALANDGSDQSRPQLAASHPHQPPSNPEREAPSASSPVTTDTSVAGSPANEGHVRSTVGMGDPSSPLRDREALVGRMGRRETCVVNASIMKSRYPHIGGKQFYKPIVVDVDLPVWEE